MIQFDKTFLTACNGSKRAELEYVCQDPQNGKFIATNGKLCLIMDLGVPPMSKHWTKKGEPIKIDGKLNVSAMYERNTEMALLGDEFKLGELSNGTLRGKKSFKKDDILLLMKFFGKDTITCFTDFSFQHNPIYLFNKDKSKEAFLVPLDEVVRNVKYVVVNHLGTELSTFATLKEAEAFADMMGLTVKEKI